MGFDETVVNRVVRLINQNEYKRYQTPPALRISIKAFGPGRKMPLVARFLISLIYYQQLIRIEVDKIIIQQPSQYIKCFFAIVYLIFQATSPA